MLINIYWNKSSDDVLVPTSAKTEAGFWLNVEPIERVQLSDTSSVKRAIRDSFVRSGFTVPTPSRSALSKSIVLAYSKAKSMGSFERIYDQLSLKECEDGSLAVIPYKPAPEGRGRVANDDLSVTYSPGIRLEEVLDGLVHSIQTDHFR